MIIRIVGEGQYKLSDKKLNDLNKVDNQIVAAVEKRDEKKMKELLKKMHDMVVKEGTKVPAKELVESDLILPPPDISLFEAERLFVEEGLIPG